MEVSVVSQIEPLGFQWKARDPFLFCVHHEDIFPKGNDEMGVDSSYLKGREIGQDFIVKDGFRMYHGNSVPGFPSHPHRGFETVTIVRKGLIDHSDSLGALGRFGNGDVQWMTAGKGVLHAEMFPLLSKEKENNLELFQIWLNLPQKSKFVEPYYKMLWSEAIPIHKYTDENNKTTTIEVIAGSIGGDKAPDPTPDSWAAANGNEVAIWNIKMEAGSKWTLPKASEGVNRNLYFYKGDHLMVQNTKVPGYHSAHLTPNFDLELECGNEDCWILILQGKPINEPVVQYGPFVMNSKQEIQQAFEDYQKTQFGGWPWPVSDPVHDRDKGRFAIYGDGKEEIK